MIAYINTSEGIKSVRISPVDIKLTDAQLEKLTKKFNKETKVLEYVGGVTYYFQKTNLRAVKSSSLEELFEMYKAYKNNLPIPERKCFFTKKPY